MLLDGSIAEVDERIRELGTLPRTMYYSTE